MVQEDITFNTIKVPVKDLEIGMFVSQLDKDWSESAFWFQGFLIENDKLLKKLRIECDYVYVDSNYLAEKVRRVKQAKKEAKKELLLEKKSFFNLNFLFRKSNGINTKVQRRKTKRLTEIIRSKASNRVIIPPKRMFSFDQEIEGAKLAQIKVRTTLKDFNEAIKHGKSIDMLAAKYAIKDCMYSLLRSPDSLLLINRLKTKRYSTWQHGVNVSVLAMALGRYLNINDEELTILGLCGMFHDVGELVISKKKLEEAGDRRELLRSHTTFGRDILLNNGGTLADVVADVAYSHHERINGSGFPQGLRDEEISPYAQIIGMVDSYDTMITDKKHAQGMTHYEAMTTLLKQTNITFNINLVNSFNQCIGTYPIGSVVEMNTGELAVVVEDNRIEKLRPKIMLVTTADKQKCDKKVVDLFETRALNDGAAYTIKAIVRADSYGLNL